MSSNNSSEDNKKKVNDINPNENVIKEDEKDKNNSQIIENNNSQKSNISLSKILDEKEIYNIPISIGHSNSNSNSNNSKSDDKSDNQENNNNIINASKEEKNNNKSNNDIKTSNINDIKNNNNIINNIIDDKGDWEMHPTEGPIGMSSASKDPEEYRHLRSIVSAFFNYQIDSLRDVARMERDFKSIGEKYLKKLSFNYTERIEKLKHAIFQNYIFLLKIADPYKNMFKLFKASSGEVLMEPLIVEGKDIIKMRSTLRLFIRDWAIDGLEERNSTYKPILNELQYFFKDKSKKDFENGINVLVPGAGWAD